MSGLPPIRIEAVVDEAEHPALHAAAEQLDESLNRPSEDRREIDLHFSPSLETLVACDPGTVVIASLLPDVSRDAALPAIESRWRRQLSSLTTPSIFLCTVFRHVPRGTADASPDARSATLERIRRLNLLATELSHDTGAAIIDIDRAFAHLGARALQTGYRLSGVTGAEVAAHTIVLALLSMGLDEAISPEAQQRAIQFHGALWQIGSLLSRRRARRR
jgi:hypothetical protein